MKRSLAIRWEWPFLRYNTLLKPDIGNTTPQVNDFCSVDKMLT